MTAAKSAAVGSVWTIPAEDRVTITRPDGSTVQVVPTDGKAHYVLSRPGKYAAGDRSVTAK